MPRTTGKIQQIEKVWLSREEAKAYLGCSKPTWGVQMISSARLEIAQKSASPSSATSFGTTSEALRGF